MKRFTRRGGSIVLLGLLAFVLALALPAWAGCSTHAAAGPSSGAGYRSSGGGAPGAGSGDATGSGGQNGAGDGGAGSDCCGDQDRDRDQDRNRDRQREGQGNDPGGVNEVPATSEEMARYARSLGLCQEFAASVAFQAGKTGVDAEKFRATLRLMAELMQQGYFSDLAPDAEGQRSGDSKIGSFARLDKEVQERLAQMLMEAVRTCDHVWLRRRLQECAVAGMTVPQAVDFLTQP